MDHRAEVKAFLTSRRARVTPEQAGMTAYSRNRRVPGLRRSEVADLAVISVEYYAQLERGDLAGASEGVLDAVAGALRLDEAERAHLHDLARAAGPAGSPARARRRPAPQQVRPGLQRLLDLMSAVPVVVNDARLDVVATNALGRALFDPVLGSPTRRAGQAANHARFTFSDPAAQLFWNDWERAADDAVAQLRTEAGRDPHDRALTDLVGELCTTSEPFRRRWAAHDVRLHRTGTKSFHHPAVGDAVLGFEALEVPADPGLTLVAFTAPAGSAADDALALLASWSASGAAHR